MDASLADRPTATDRHAWASADDVAAGESSTWCPFADDARTRGIPCLVDRGLLDRAAGDQLSRRLDGTDPRFAMITDGRRHRR